MDSNAHPLHMTRRCHCEQPGCELEHGASAMPGVVETSTDQSWTDFCASLTRNAILLADTGFGGLEQA